MGIFEQNAEAALGDDNLLETLENDAANAPNEVLSTLVGEGRKFRDVEALAKGKVVSDAFIEKLIAEKRELEQKLNETKRIEDFMTEISNLTPNRNEPSIAPKPGAERDAGENASIDPQALVEQTLKAIEERNKSTTEEQNINKVKAALQNQYGPRWLKTLEEFSGKLGMDKQTVDNWVKANPDAVIQAVVTNMGGVPVSPTNNSPSRVSIPGSTNASGPNTGLKTYKDFQAVKAKDPARYNSREFQVLLHDTAVKMGDAFFT